MKWDATGLYILKDGKPVPCDDTLAWGEWFSRNEGRIVARDEDVDGYFVSTVFMGIDHSFGFSPVPILFETMAWKHGQDSPVVQLRYCCADFAREQHRKVVESVPFAAKDGVSQGVCDKCRATGEATAPESR